MKLTWDEPKRLSNIDKHGLDFADLTIEFFLEATIVPGKDGRRMAIGFLNGGPDRPICRIRSARLTSDLLGQYAAREP